ncbi:hypothetical protein HX836_19100 [Pseudomonas yamanorum]|uniref:hypothetical protein n=1 Tax=Pseudomonas yamanorum TaxID=515393 RepID=UPI0015A21C2E|nr:hypothetical protein [Pseudomonas yamanorum]NVZ83925.1 hypothetical protein [Pseudomonas yamanorum]
MYDSVKVNDTTGSKESRDFVYDYRRVPEFVELEGRLFLDYTKPRGNYLWLETCLRSMVVSSILEKPMTVGRFPGFKEVGVSHGELKIIVLALIEN